MKKILSLFVVIAILIAMMPLGAFTLTVGAATSGYYNYIIEDNGATIISVDQNISGDITIPAYLGGYPVKTIGGAAFSYCLDIVSVVIPDTVTLIGDDAFYYCQSLTEVVIPNSVTSIGYTAFAMCTSLSRITIPESVTYIASDAFNYSSTAICGYEGTYAQTYANENGLLFIALYDCKGQHTAMVDADDNIVYMLYESHHAKFCWLCGEEFDNEAHTGEFICDADEHTGVCSVCGLEILETGAHSFNSDSICDICGYGCTHDAITFVATVDATCTTPAIGMLICECCGVVISSEANDPTGDVNPYAHVYDDEKDEYCNYCNNFRDISTHGTIDLLEFGDYLIEIGSTSMYFDTFLADFGEVGTAEDPIIIDSAEELVYLCKASGNETKGKYYKVADGIAGFNLATSALDVEGTLADNLDVITGSGKNHAGNTPGFQGHFDGNGATVYGAWTNPNNGGNPSTYVGLFSCTYGEVTIKNINVNKAYFVGKSAAGGIIGYHKADDMCTVTIENCSVTDSYIEVQGTGYGTGVGAILGYGASAPAKRESYDGVDYNGDGDTVDTIYINVAYNIKNCFVNLDEANFVSSAEDGTEVSGERVCHGGVAGILGSNALKASDCIIIGIKPYATSECTTANDVQHSGLESHFTNVYTTSDVAITGVNLGGTTAMSNRNFTNRIFPLADNQLKGAAAVKNMDLDWSVWMADDEGYPELSSAHKYTSIVSNNDGTHSEICVCGFGGATVDCSYVDRVCECGAEITCGTRKTIYWDGTVATGISKGTGTQNDPYVISTASEFAWLIQNGKADNTTGKYYKIDDSIGSIVLQREAYARNIMALTSSAAVKVYFEDTSKSFASWITRGWEQSCFAGHFDGNGVIVYGLYQVSPNNAGLFSTIDAGASIHNIAVKNSYIVGNSSTANYQVGAIAATTSSSGYGIKQNGIIWFEGCVVANNYMYNNSTSHDRSGVIIGASSDVVYIDNCLVYGNDATYGDGVKMPLLSCANNALLNTATAPDGLVTKDDGERYYNMVRNSVIFDTPPYDTAQYLGARFNDPRCYENVYTDSDIANDTFANNTTMNVTDGQIKQVTFNELASIELGDAWIITSKYPELKAFHDSKFEAKDTGKGTHITICSCETVVATGLHIYDDDDDEDCNICGLIREVYNVDYTGTEGYYTYDVVDGKAKITLVDQSISGDVIIPTILGGYPVVSIGGFRCCNYITSVTIPDGVTDIEYGAFYSCDGLTSISLPNTLTSIDGDSFYGCINLESVILPDSLISIGSGAFTCCESLTSINIPASVTSIHLLSFDACISLAEINVDKNNNYYSSLDGVLFNKNITTVLQYPRNKENTTYALPNSVISIGKRAFGYCTNLTHITIPQSVTSVADNAFLYCDNFTICGYEGSYAQTYAEENGLLFIALYDGTSDATFTVVDTPVSNTAYKFGMIQENVSTTDVYYLAGGMDGYYMNTTIDSNSAIDVYLEETTGGYYLYTMVDGAKTYINMVVSGTYVNGAYETTASTVYTYDATAKTIIATVNDTPYWFGTRNDKSYTTVGPSATSYNGFYCNFYAEATSDDNTGNESGSTTFDPTNKTPAEIVNAAYALATGDTIENVTLTGKIVNIDQVYSAVYGNITVTIAVEGADAEKTIQCYRMTGENIADLTYDDVITVTGTIKNYNGTIEFDKPVCIAIVKSEVADNVLTIKEALELGVAQDNSTYTVDKYYVTGKIVTVLNTQYGNMYIADEEGNEILIYGTYGADGKDRYDALASKPDKGDTVTVYGVVGNYNGTPQLKNGWIIEFTEGESDVETPAEPEADSVLTIKEAIALGLTKRSDEYTTNKYYVTGEITEIYNEEYGNMRITDEEGNILTLYATWNETGETRYDAMGVKPEVGDTITVYGIIGQYNGTPEMKDGWIIAFTSEDDDNISGDVNNDGRINNKDLVVLQRYLNEWDVEINCNAADVNGDGVINNKDFGLLMQYRCGWPVELC